MKRVCSFLVKFSSIISWVLSCFDRVIFKGHLPISRPSQFEGFVDHVDRNTLKRIAEPTPNPLAAS